jgi:peptidoglycan-N-acetylglucosamine deacetylase
MRDRILSSRAAYLALGLLLLVVGQGSACAGDCADNPETTGLSRTIAIESGNGPQFGKLQYERTAPLKDKEVVLTFDDGPHPQNTRIILDVLDRHCVKATFFAVGKMAQAYPQALKEVIARGHTVGSHTYSHPMDMSRLALDDARVEIEKGYATVSQAVGAPIAPFFRFPGLNESRDLDAYLASRDVSIWSVDVVSNDTGPNMSQQRLVGNVMNRLSRIGKGIILFHDLKHVTAEGLDAVLVALRSQGYKVVHVVSNTTFTPNAELLARAGSNKHMQASAYAVAGRSRGKPAVGDEVVDVKPGRNESIKTDFIHIDTSVSGSPGRR